MDEHQHIASAFDRDLREIQAQVMTMGGLVEAAIRDSADALKRQDIELAQAVRERDRDIDRMEMRINEACARLLALRQPIASDLRVVLSVMKIAGNLERLGDYAKNLAKRIAVLMETPSDKSAIGSILRMADEVNGMLSDVLDAFIRHDAALADQVRHRDIEVDQLYNALFREMLTFMMEDPRTISGCMHLHFIAKNTERMGDHVTNIAEQVIYMVTGRMPEESRPKASEKSYEPAAKRGD